ncbi:MAG TPA: amidohydrolase family protein, partial [Thermoanaerobaculia bacterium]
HGSFLDDEALRLMKERGTYFVPTLMAGEYAGGRKAKRQYPPEIAAKAKAALEARSSAMRAAVKAGVKIAFGTDAGGFPWTEINQAQEFEHEVRLGMSPLEAIRSATTVAAELLGTSGRAGAVEAGAWADLVAVTGDPLKDVSVLSRIDFVMKNGEVVRAPAPRE